MLGNFRGTTLIQRRGSIGGAKNVFVKLKGIKNELVYPTFGGKIENPFPGTAKFFAGDLIEFRTDEKGLNPKVILLKTYKVTDKVTSAATINIERNGYRHIPFVGDKIGVAPTELGGSITTELVIQSVKEKQNSKGADIWEITVNKSSTISEGAVLVETDGAGKMMVKKINAFADCDIDFLYAPSTGDEDFDGARYLYTPAIGGAKMYIYKMSPMPACVLNEKVNYANMNGWFGIKPL